MKSITFVSSALEPWGAETSLATISRALIASGQEVEIVVPLGSASEYLRHQSAARITTYPKGRNRVKTLLNASSALKKRRSTGPVVVFSVDLMPVPLLVRSDQMIYDIHDTPNKWITRFTMRILSQGYRGAIAISDYSAAWAHGFSKVAVVPRPIEVEASLLQPSPSSVLTVGIVGRLSQEKRIDLLVDAMADSAHILHVYGSAFSGSDEYAKRLIERARAKLGDRLVECGHVSRDIIYSQIDVLVVTNEREPSGRTAGEASAHGIAIVVPDLGGASEFAARGAGLAFKSGSSAALRDALDELTSPEVRARMGSLGRAQVIRERNPERIGHLYLKAVQEAIID